MGRKRRSRRNRRRSARRAPSRRRNTRTSQGRRAANRSAARSRAQRAAKKRVSARKAAGRKPSGAKSASQRKADNRSRAQAAATNRRKSGKTISQVKAANKKRMQDAARERNRKFQAERAAKSTSAPKKTINKVSASQFDSRRNETFNNQLQKIQTVNKPLGNPAVMSADGTFNRPGPGGPESEANYTSYKPGSFYNQSDTNVNMTNALRSGRNLITSPFRGLGINNQFTNRLIPKSNEAIQDSRDQRGPRPTLTRRRSGGGSSRIAQQVAAQQMQPEIAPTIGTPAAEEYIESAPQGDLTRIQSQAYNTQLTSSLANMFGGQGSAGYTPQGSPELSPTLQAGQSRGRRRVRMFGGRSRRGGRGDQFQRAGDRISRLTNINI